MESEAIILNVLNGDWQMTAHANARMASKDIGLTDILAATKNGKIIEHYPDFHLGPSILVLGKSELSLPLHVVWGIVKGTDKPAYLVTAYWPTLADWHSDFATRKK